MGKHWEHVTDFPEELSLPALLDEAPEAAYGASEAEQPILTILRPRRWRLGH
jgi:hypothetical protein